MGSLEGHTQETLTRKISVRMDPAGELKIRTWVCVFRQDCSDFRLTSVYLSIR